MLVDTSWSPLLFQLVHSSDHTRLDIVMPGGRHIYLKASSTVERQQWVVALGTSKQDEEGTMEKCESLSWELYLLVHIEVLTLSRRSTYTLYYSSVVGIPYSLLTTIV